MGLEEKVKQAYREMGGPGNPHARLLRGLSERLDAAKHLLERFVNELPTRRDWLDPDLERAAREFVKRK